jgi:hypothetical protein
MDKQTQVKMTKYNAAYGVLSPHHNTISIFPSLLLLVWKLPRIYICTECFTDLGKVNLAIMIRFKARANFYYCLSCHKRKEAYLKSGQN